MPTISMFFGIIIRMYCSPKEHNPPHFHAYYQSYKITINIKTGKVTSGKLPSKQLKFVLAWTEIHKDELIADWKLASHGELPFKIEGLK